jgi:hypothetical protein
MEAVRTIIPPKFRYHLSKYTASPIRSAQNESTTHCKRQPLETPVVIDIGIHNHIYRVIQEYKSIFWEVVVTDITRNKLHRNMCNSELSPRYCCVNIQIQKHCEWY